ncbi:hypothetical protein [Streptomyces caelestis]|uniref:hypothetical protein n=1 Tax=Streptomyces caelestis TaxID=36816 RepID=UPI0036F913A6
MIFRARRPHLGMFFGAIDWWGMGTRRIARIEENTGGTQLPFSAGELADLNELAGRIGVHGDRSNEHRMSLVDK